MIKQNNKSKENISKNAKTKQTPNKTITKTEDAFLKELNITREEYAVLFERKGAKISAGNLDKKVEFFMTTFDITRQQVAQLFIKFKSLLDIDIFSNGSNSAGNKIKTLTELGYTKSDIINHPLVLTMPNDKIAIRYALSYILSKEQDFFLRSGRFLFNEDKVFARYMYLKSIKKLDFNACYKPEKEFAEKFKVISEYLLGKYRFTPRQKKKVMAESVSIKKKQEKLAKKAAKNK